MQSYRCPCLDSGILSSSGNRRSSRPRCEVSCARWRGCAEMGKPAPVEQMRTFHCGILVGYTAFLFVKAPQPRPKGVNQTFREKGIELETPQASTAFPDSGNPLTKAELLPEELPQRRLKARVRKRAGARSSPGKLLCKSGPNGCPS